MQAHRVSATVSKQKTITLEHLPFAEGEQVNVIIIPEQRLSDSDNRYPLKGTPIQYANPIEPVAVAPNQINRTSTSR